MKEHKSKQEKDTTLEQENSEQSFQDGEQAATHAEGTMQDDNDVLAAMETQLQEANDKYLRLAAEFDNFRKRNAREKQDLIKNASEDLILSLLEVLDDSERAAQQMETSDDWESVKQGIQLIFQKLKKVLEQRGLQEIEAINEPFNTDLHEAITEIPAGSEEQKGLVMDQVIKGYKLNDKVIRHSKVVVGK